MFVTDAKSLIVFDMSPESFVTTTMPAYSILGLIERLGGFVVVLIFVGKFIVNSIADRIMQ